MGCGSSKVVPFPDVLCSIKLLSWKQVQERVSSGEQFTYQEVASFVNKGKYIPAVVWLNCCDIPPNGRVKKLWDITVLNFKMFKYPIESERPSPMEIARWKWILNPPIQKELEKILFPERRVVLIP